MRFSAISLALMLMTGQLAASPPEVTATAQSATRPSSSTKAADKAAAERADAKFHHIEVNSMRAYPDQQPTTFTELEINAYINSGDVELPKGVERVRFTGRQDVITTNTLVDFDKVTEGRSSMNPLMTLFSGIHEVQVVSHAEGSGGIGRVHIDSVSIDGVTVPRIALEFFVDHYIKPKYPDLGLDSRFQLPDRIDIAKVGDHTLIITQK